MAAPTVAKLTSSPLAMVAMNGGAKRTALLAPILATVNGVRALRTSTAYDSSRRLANTSANRIDRRGVTGSVSTPWP